MENFLYTNRPRICFPEHRVKSLGKEPIVMRVIQMLAPAGELGGQSEYVYMCAIVNKINFKQFGKKSKRSLFSLIKSLWQCDSLRVKNFIMTESMLQLITEQCRNQSEVSGSLPALRWTAHHSVPGVPRGTQKERGSYVAAFVSCFQTAYAKWPATSRACCLDIPP